jgi:RND family efflux transporter MFP subunit
MRRPHKLYVVVVILLAGLSTFGCAQAPTQEKSREADSLKVPVILARVVLDGGLADIDLIGTVRYQSETPLAFTTSGKIANIGYREGDSVVRGALLAALDTTSVDSELEAVRAEQTRATAVEQRLTLLFRDGWVTKAQLEVATAARSAADAKRRAASFAVTTARLTAPSGGRVLARAAEPGQVVAAGFPILVLGEANGGVVLRASTRDKYAARLRIGMPALVSIPALNRPPIKATVRSIDGRADPATGLFNVVFSLPDYPLLRSGQIGTARVTLSTVNGTRLQIPTQAITDVRAGEGVVFVYDATKSRALPRNVIVDEVGDGRLLVHGDLRVGELVVASGANRLRGAQEVIVQNSVTSTSESREIANDQ